jgi:uncharacterized protein YjdB
VRSTSFRFSICWLLVTGLTLIGLAGCGGGDNNAATVVVPTAAGPTPTVVAISVTPASASVRVGATQQFTVTGTQSNGTTVALTSSATWVSSAPAVATVSASGLATAVGTGQTTVTATANGLSASATLVVPGLQGLAITPANPTLNLGSSMQLTLTGTYTDGSTQDLTATATWSSANPALVTVSPSGALTANSVSGGSTVVTAAVGGLSANTTVTVSGVALQSLTIFPGNVPVVPGFPQQASALATYVDGTVQNVSGSVTWSTATPTIATVSAAGVVSGVAAGTSPLSAAFGSFTATATATVTVPTLTAVRISPENNPILAPGKVSDFSAYGDFSDGSALDITSSVVWASDTPATATISSGGQVTAVAPGMTNISATSGAIVGNQALTVNNGATNYAEHRVPFTYQDISTTGTVVDSGDDVASFLPLMSFDFSYFGNAFTTDQMSVCSNGFLQFNGTDTSTGGSQFPVATPTNIVCPYFGDLVTAASFRVFGTAGSRQLIVQFDGGIFRGSSDTQSGAALLQVVLYEGTNAIDFRYLNVDPLQGSNSDNGGMTVGVEDGTGTIYTQHSFQSKSIFSGTAIRYMP